MENRINGGKRDIYICIKLDLKNTENNPYRKKYKKTS